jgi:maleylpyruvate isomerase
MANFRDGEAFFLGLAAALDDDDLAAPSALPGWTRAHVVGHLARNADALGNLLAWARTGEPSPMYPSAEARADGIEQSARQGPDALRDDLVAASGRLVAAVDALPDEAWEAPVRTARGRPITATEVPWMRIRETWVHAVDLGTGVTFAEVPSAVVDELLDEVAAGLAGREDCPALLLVDVAGGPSRRIGPAGAHVEVSGPAADLLAWLIGRADGSALAAGPDGGRPPAPPAWL